MKGVKFDNIHSYYDLHLILSGCSISPATPKENYIDIPGADGSIDLTEALGEVKYNDRTGTLIFSVLPADDFEEKKSEISNLLNGKKFKITLDKDPDWFYIGRCSVSDYKADKKLRQITVDLKLQPFKYAPEKTVKFWGLQSNAIITVKGLPIIPVFKFTEPNITMHFNGVSYNVGAGQYKFLDIVLTAGENHFHFNTSRETHVTYQERSL